MHRDAEKTYILLVVPCELLSGQALAAELSAAANLGAARARARALIDADSNVWRVMVLDAHSGQVVGLVTRQAPHWELPLMLTHASFATH